MGSYEISNGVMIYYLPKELDHYEADLIKRKSEAVFETEIINYLIFDFKETVFMDSSGIGLVMGRYKTISELSGELAIVNTSPSIGKVMKLAGMERLAKIGMEEISNETN